MIKLLEWQDIPQVVEIHKNELNGFLAKLGEGFLVKFYKVSIDIPEMFTLVEKENEQVLGFATGATRVKGLYKKIFFRDLFSFVWLLLNNFITHPENIVGIVKSLTYPGFRDDIPELLLIAVSKSYQKRGIGGNLFLAAATEFQKRGYKNFRISVYDKLTSNNFYKKIGCKWERSFNFLGEKMNSYIFSPP